MAPGQGDMIIRGNNIKDFFDTDVLVITLPFRRSFADPADYQKQISAILCESKNVPIVFTSSTSVYPDNMPMAFEDAQFVPDNERRQVLAQVEKDILKRRGTVVRLAGLYGAGRNIGNFLAGKKELSGGDSPVNLIHQEDAVGILCAVIAQRHKVAGEIFNVCTDEHPLKKDLYAAAAKRLNVAAPEFAEEKSSKIKIVTNEKVKKVLGYQFIHPDPMKDI